MKKNKKFIALLLLVVTLMTTGLSALSVSAVEGSYNKFHVSGKVAQCTSEIKNNNKDKTYYWVWAAPPTDRDKIVHRTYVHNSEHETRSGALLTYEGTTHQAVTTTTKYIYYHIEVRRHLDSDDFAYLSGTWGWIY